MERFVNGLVSFGERWFMQRGWRRTTVSIATLCAFVGFHVMAVLSGGIPREFLAADFFFIVLAAASMGWWGGLGVAFLAGIVTGPVFPFFAYPQEVASPLFWAIRIATFTLFGFIASLSSIVFRLQVQRQKETDERFFHAQKMEAIGRLTGAVSHDFNNMLTAIGGYAHLLLLDAETGKDPAPVVQDLLDVVDRSASLTHQLLAISRKQSADPRAFDLVEGIRSLGKMLDRLVGDAVELRLEVSDDSWPVQVDPGQLDQVLMNLAVNAADAMPRGGRLTIRTEKLSVDELFAAQHPNLRRGDYMMITVSDTGLGIAEEITQKVFEPFFTTKGVGKGTGLGLYTVYSIVRQSQGDIWFSSIPQRGTSFKICLPRAIDEAPLPVARRLPAGPRAVRADATIMVAEDDAHVRSVISGLLMNEGYKVIPVEDGESACALIEKSSDRIDMLITDVVMPRQSGLEVIRTVYRLQPSIGVIVTSGAPRDEAENIEITALSEGFLEKPFSGDRLLQMVRQILG